MDLGSKDFPTSEPIHIIAPISATFLRQRATQLEASFKRPKVESSTGDASRPPSSGEPSSETYIDPTATVDPPPSTSGDSSLQSMLDTVMIVQTAHRQLLLDVLNELHAL